MKNGRSTNSPTKAQVKRFQAIADIGCLACILEGRAGEPPDIQHLLSGGKRRGHDATIGLCPWHHRGQPKGDLREVGMQALFGPSMHHHRRAFIERYGTDDELLAMQDRLIARYSELAK